MAVDASIFNGLIQPVRSVADYENAFAERANQKVKNALAMRQMALQEKEMSQHEAVQNALSQHGLTAAGADAVARAGGVQGMELGMKIRAQLEAQRKEQERQAALRSLMPVTGIDANKVSGVTGPRPEALGVVGQQQPFNPAQFLAAGMDPKQVEGIQALVAPKPKVKDYKPVRMPDGSVQLVGLTEDGRAIQTGQTPFEKPSIHSFGDYIGGIDSVSGKVTRYGATSQTPDSVARTGLGYAQLGETGRHNQAAEAAAALKANSPPKQGPMSATLQKELIESDDTAQAAKNVVKSLQAALSLNDAAYSGYLAKPRAVLASNTFGGKSADATIDIDNLMTGQGLESLKSIFGAAPTEGERKILMDMQASVDKTPAQRKAIMERAIAAAKTRAAYAENKAKAIRGGSYLTDGAEAPAAQSEKSVVRTGVDKQGRKVVQYSDGSLEYAK
jgi:hypothetical protein